jgi:Small integral membrane protein (DUF2273).
VPDRENELLKFWKAHKGAIIGTGLGLLAGILILSIGFFQTLFLAICAAVGAFFGTNTRVKKRLRETLDRVLPDMFRHR